MRILIPLYYITFSEGPIVGWSDIELFVILENGHYAADNQVYFFMSPISKTQRIWLRARQSFYSQKITGTLKINFCFENFKIPSLYFKEQLPNRKFKKNYAPKWANFV